VPLGFRFTPWQTSSPSPGPLSDGFAAVCRTAGIVFVAPATVYKAPASPHITASTSARQAVFGLIAEAPKSQYALRKRAARRRRSAGFRHHRAPSLTYYTVIPLPFASGRVDAVYLMLGANSSSCTAGTARRCGPTPR